MTRVTPRQANRCLQLNAAESVTLGTIAEVAVGCERLFRRWVQLQAALIAIQAAQLLAERVDVRLGTVQRALTLRRQPLPRFASQPAALLSPLRGQQVAFLSELRALRVLRQAVAGVRQQRRGAAEVVLQPEEIMQCDERIRTAY